MQRFIEMINREDEKEVIFQSIKQDIVLLAFHSKGNYVLTPIINLFKGEKFDYIVEELLDQVVKLSTDQYGVCILNQLSKLIINKKHIQRIVQALANNINEIIQSQYGNYAITTSLEIWTEEGEGEPILDKLVEFFQQFSIQKFSSNVIEKCVERSGQ